MKPFFKQAAILFLSILLFQCKSDKKPEVSPEITGNTPTYARLEAGKLEALTDAFWTLIPSDAGLEILAEGHDWTEGPLWIEEDSMLLYTDIPRNAVYRWKEGEGASLYLQPSGFLGSDFKGAEPGANGLVLNEEGSLILCQHGERQVSRMTSPLHNPEPEYQVLASRYDGKRFNSPNDAVYKSNGDLYFTDPPYGLPKLMEDPAKELPFQGVYRLTPKGDVTLLTASLSRPNGIGFSPDEKVVYISNSDPDKAIWKAFDLTDDGLLTNERIFYDATTEVAGNKGLPDGLTVHPNGTLFATGPGGIYLFSPEGTLLGRIYTGQATSNLAFKSDMSALFITADEYLLRLKLK